MPGRIPDPHVRARAVYEALIGGNAGTPGPASAAQATSPSAATAARSSDYESWSVDDLRHRAAELDISGRSTMRKDELIAALRRS